MKLLMILCAGALFFPGVIMPKKDSLKTYKKRRNLKKSGEPVGASRKPSKNAPHFVIQKHAASHLHYDFRLEIDGVLASWAVPKGPSMNPSVKRLAVPTDDHPLDYERFEGIIPAGNYGAGTVMVWDIGTYENLKSKSMAACWKEGRIEICLQGAKLEGAFALIKTKLGWLLFKLDDEFASKKKNPVNTQKKSALTDRTMAQIKKDETKKGGAQWHSASH